MSEIPDRVISAIKMVETRNNANKIRFEPHLFHRDTEERYLQQIPWTKSNRPHAPNTSFIASETNKAAFERAYNLDKRAAVTSTSWGAGQVLGSVGIRIYGSPEAFVAAFEENPNLVSEELISRYFQGRPPLVAAVQRQDWPEVARMYNGARPPSPWYTKFLTYLNDPSATAEPETRRATTSPRNAVDLSNPETRDRIQLMTSGRASPPSNQYNYYTLSSSEADQQSALGNFENVRSIQDPYDDFYGQMQSFSHVSTLQASRATPVLEVWTRDEQGNVVNLNNLIFTKSPISNFQDDPTGYHPERPIASLVDFSVTVQQPSVGGPTGIKIGRLTIKVHNPYAVNEDHPRGKFIHWMLKQGFNIRIKYGLSSNFESIATKDYESLNNAFRVLDEEFFVAQHELTVENNLETTIVLTVMPAISKLLNQINIGESLPIERFELDEQVVNRSVEGVVRNNEQAQLFSPEIKRNIIQFQREFNSRRQYIGTDSYRREDGTFGSVLLGAVSNLEIFQESTRLEPFAIRSTVEALKTIQSSLLASAFDNIVKANSYLKKIRERYDFLAVNLGPIIAELAFPEIRKIVDITNRTGIGFDPQENRSEKRNQISIVFGNFNSNAGDWAQKPISSFPINVDTIISHIRRERDVGKFFSTFNSFLGMLFSQTNNRDLYTPTPVSQPDGTIIYVMEIPEVKYRLYPDPNDENNWIFYIYDNKQFSVDIHNLIKEVRTDKNLIQEKCQEKRVFYLKPGTNNHFVKNIEGSTKSDDRIQSLNMFRANQTINQRRSDAARIVGIDANFLAGGFNNIEGEDQQAVFRSTSLIMPLKVNIDHLFISSSLIWAHLFLDFPIEQFSQLYTIYEVTHTVNKSEAKTSFTLQVQL